MWVNQLKYKYSYKHVLNILGEHINLDANIICVAFKT